MFMRGVVNHRVRALLDCADRMGVDQSCPADLAPAVEQLRGKPLYLDLSAELPAGVSGRWCAMHDADSVAVAAGWPTASRALAHEYGHMILGHTGLPIADGTLTPRVGPATAQWMLMRCQDATAGDRHERQAERFAETLCRELARRSGYAAARRPGVLADAFG